MGMLSIRKCAWLGDLRLPGGLVAGLKAPNLNKWRFRRILELQNAAMESRLENIGRMIEDIEISQRRKADRQARFSQQNEESEKRRIERAQRNQKEREDAEQKRQGRARRAQHEQNEVDK